MEHAEAQAIVDAVLAGTYAGPPRELCVDLHARLAEAQRACDTKQWALARACLTELYNDEYQPAKIACDLAQVAMELGEPTEAIRWYRAALSHDPTLVSAHEHLIFLVDAQPTSTDTDANLARQSYVTQFSPRTSRPHANACDPDRPIVVGYVSGDWNFHSAAFAFGAVLMHHSAQIVPKFYGTLDTKHYDGTTASWRAKYPHAFTDVSGLTAKQLAAVIRDDGVDILVDLAGYTHNNRLQTFLHQPAPIQVEAWGYVLGTQSPRMTHIFADPIACPPAVRARLTETVVDLPSLLGFEPRADLPENDSPLPCLSGPPSFAVFQRAMKTNPETWRVWQDLLRRVPEATLTFKAPDYTPDIRGRLVDAMPDVRGQLVFAPHENHRDHLLSYAAMDLSLDPWPQTGGVSTLESLWMGVPIVTLCGARMIQRTSASILTNVGFEDCIATTESQYVAIAASLVTTQRDRLAEMRRTARARMRQSPIMNGYVEAVEAAYRTLWRDYCANAKDQAA